MIINKIRKNIKILYLGSLICCGGVFCGSEMVSYVAKKDGDVFFRNSDKEWDNIYREQKEIRNKSGIGLVVLNAGYLAYLYGHKKRNKKK